jgi:lipopolysaccharide transport system ATP-binding protein
MSDTLIKVEGLSKKFCRDFRTSLTYALADVGGELIGAKRDGQDLRPKEFWALKDISFDLKRGETLGLLGANGAGKSTLLKLLNGLIKPSAGRVEINGSMQALIELGGAFSPQLSGRENIYASAAMIGMGRKDIEAKFDEIVAFAELQDFIDAPVGTYSSGMKTRLGFSVATCIRPEILILDEVLSVGDESFKRKSLDYVARLREEASGVIFVSHNMNQIRRICTKCIVLDGGLLKLIASPDMAIAHYYELLNSKQKMTKYNTKNSDIYFLVKDGSILIKSSDLHDCPENISYLNITMRDSNEYIIFSKSIKTEKKISDISIEIPPLNPGLYEVYVSVSGEIVKYDKRTFYFEISAQTESLGILDPEIKFL